MWLVATVLYSITLEKTQSKTGPKSYHHISQKPTSAMGKMPKRFSVSTLSLLALQNKNRIEKDKMKVIISFKIVLNKICT